MDILEEIVAHKRVEIDERKRFVPIQQFSGAIQQMMDEGKPASMSKALMSSDTGVIAEFKRKSPSKGWIHRDVKPEDVTPLYQANGASALSILTDTQYFGGYDEYIQQARQAGVTIPILYKNFIIDEYQLFQARYCGASAVLLIAACLTKDECKHLQHLAHELGLETLLEMHNDRDFDYATLEPDMYGINNRNLGTFVTDVNNSFRLAERLPKGACLVSESGISHPGTVKELRDAGFNGFLIGERFMREKDPGIALKQFIGEL
ncbi:MAG TPA: indole-3-glycerol phosphate synthase TrpC [Prevotella sp.]|nr:indole-3-glycerol phosphate synthase TrpC [Prevotella sp.]